MDHEAAARSWHRATLLAGRLDVASEACTPAVLVHAPGLPGGAQSGVPALERLIADVHSAFRVEAAATDEVIVDGDRAVARWTVRAIHVGPYLGIDPTGRRIEISGIDVLRFEGHRIAEVWQAWDRLGVAARLGAAADPARVSPLRG